MTESADPARGALPAGWSERRALAPSGDAPRLRRSVGRPACARPRRRPTMGLARLILLSGLAGGGCVGYLTGSYDAEMQRMRAVAAELEAKNAALVEECLELRERVRELERGPAPGSEGGAQTSVGP